MVVMEKIVLTNQTSNGEQLEAIFLPEVGMNMISFKKGNVEVIDQSTAALFEERSAGLGALIGPHFHHRHVIPAVKDESLFPHIARVKAKGIQEPFSHGIGRYAPWKAEAAPTSVQASISGKDLWNGIPLADLEGQNFKMNYTANLLPDGLHIELSVVSDTDSLVGIHYYYKLPNSKGKVVSQVQKSYLDMGVLKTIPESWQLDQQHVLTYTMDQPADFTFYPHPNPCEGEIRLVTEEYTLNTRYKCISQESAWQLFHPADASYVCIEPVSAKDPRHPNLTVSSLNIHLNIEKD